MVLSLTEDAGIIYPSLTESAGYSKLIKDIRPDDLHFMKQIVYPSEKKTYQYDMEFEEWFMAVNRKEWLHELTEQ